ncbi:MAG: chorismate synthase [Planctomycetota bacterium]|nr:chorismate synthase [Planctomycetota bacterium]
MLRYWTAGESHGKALLALIDGFPAGMDIDTAWINRDLRLRQGGYGRGGRQKLETDEVDVLTGIWQGKSIGSPIALQVINRDYKLERLKELERPRPGHADLTGAVKYLGSIRGVLERSSARETTVRVAAGSLARQLLRLFGIETLGYVVNLGGHAIVHDQASNPLLRSIPDLRETRDSSSIYSLNPAQDKAIEAYIDQMADEGDTLGGIVEVRVDGLPFGLGTHAQWDRKLDGKLAQAVMAVQAIKGVEIGMGFEAAVRRGSEVHDPIGYDASQAGTHSLGYTRPTNNAGGLEGGMTNGQSLIIRAGKKPISTLRKPLDSIRMEDKEPHRANYERSDVCAVSAAAIIVESVVAFELASALVEKFGGDSIAEMQARYELFQSMASKR